MPILAAEIELYPDGLLDEPPDAGRPWRVAHTKPRQEKALARELLAADIPFYLPCDRRRICLDVNAPAWHEGYHRRWTRGTEGDALGYWSVELPLFGNGQILGRLSVSGSHERDRIAENLAALSRLVEQAEALAAAISLPAALASRRAVQESIPAPV